MGYNSVAVIFNDHIGQMKDDSLLGARIAQAIRGWHMRDRDNLATWFGSGQICSQGHADYSQVVVVGQNRGRRIVDCDDLDHYALGQIADALRRHGWDVKPLQRVKGK